MKFFASFIFFLIPIIGQAEVPIEKVNCDATLTAKDRLSLEKCFTWLNFANETQDVESKASANIDYAQALQYANRSVDAEMFLVQATKEAAWTNNPLIIAVSSETLARYYYKEKKYSKVISPIQIAIKNYTSSVGAQHMLTIHSAALVADVNRLEGHYADAIEVANRVLHVIPESDRDKLAVSAHLHNVRALSNEKLGNYKNVSSDYLHAAQIMEKIDVSSSIVFWKNLKSFLVEQNLTSDTSAVDKRITLLENVVKNEKWQEQLAPRVSLEISKSSVKQ